MAMAKHYRKMVVHGDHLTAADTGPPWIVLWETTARADGQWSTVRSPTQAEAFERAAHFVKLGFVVHAIKDPTGLVVMDAESIVGRFAPAKESPPRTPPGDRTAPSVEEAARDMLRGFFEDDQAMPGRMLESATLHARLSLHALSMSEFDRAVSFAEAQGWLNVGDGILTLTQEGFAAATA
jgi:hypothetical protein